jgi:hypothetical protein
MYEVLVAWESDDILVDVPPFIRDFASIWRAADKIVYSKSLESVSGARTRIERAFDPDAVRRMKAAADRDLSIGGPDLPHRRSARGWSKRSSCSCRRSWSGAATRPFPMTSASASSCWTSGGSETASCTSDTRPESISRGLAEVIVVDGALLAGSVIALRSDIPAWQRIAP